MLADATNYRLCQFPGRRGASRYPEPNIIHFHVFMRIHVTRRGELVFSSNTKSAKIEVVAYGSKEQSRPYEKRSKHPRGLTATVVDSEVIVV